MKTISILTPVSRPQNLHKIYEDLCQYIGKIKIIWYICYDASLLIDKFVALEDKKDLYIVQAVSPYKNAVGGHLHRNYILSNMKGLNSNRFIYFLDDDNLLHPNFVDFVSNNELDLSVYMFSQVRWTGNKIADLKTLKIGHVDTAQILCRLYCFQDFEFPNIYEADGHWIMHLWNKYSGYFKMEKDIFTYYNKLRP